MPCETGNRDTIVENFVLEAQDDLVGLWEIVGDVRSADANADEILERSLGIVEALLEKGLLAGDPPYSEHGYHPWPDQSPKSVVARIRSEWLALGREPHIGDIVWFSRPGLNWGEPAREHEG